MNYKMYFFRIKTPRACLISMISTIVFFSLPMSCCAYHGNIVTLLTDNGGYQSFYGLANLNIPIKYYISPDFRTIPLELNGYTSSVNAVPAAERALEHLRTITTGQEHVPPVTFALIDEAQNADLLFQIREEGAPADPNIIAYHTCCLATQPDTITVVPSRYSMALQRMRPTFALMSRLEFFDLALTVTMHHEMLHAFGLAHPHHADNPDVMPFPQDFRYFTAQNLSVEQLRQPHIMMTSMQDFLTELRDVMGHDPEPDEAIPSEAEAQAIQYLNANGGQCIPSSKIKNKISSPQCSFHDPSGDLLSPIYNLLFN